MTIRAAVAGRRPEDRAHGRTPRGTRPRDARTRRATWLLLPLAALGALAFARAASAHVVANPSYIPSGSDQTILFSEPNERQRPMTSFTLVAPSGLEIEHAHPVDGWTEEFTTTTATWTGGSLAPLEDLPFQATLKATAKPGIVNVKADQRYADGGIVSWSVPITVVPAEASPSQNLALAGVVGLLGVLVVAAVGMLAWRRRSAPPHTGPDT